MCLHLIALFTIFVLPAFLSGGSSYDKRSSTMTKLQTTYDNSSLNNDEMKRHLKNENNSLTTQNEESVAATLCSNSSTPIPEPDESSNSSSSCSSFSNSLNDIRGSCDKSSLVRKADTNYLLKDLINKEVNKIKDETDNLSNLLMEKIEAANFEGLIDKTVSGIVELKDDLMRMNEPEVYGPPSENSLRKRNIINHIEMESSKGSNGSEASGVDAFLKKEIDAIKKEVTVIPAVLSNGHAK
jgi:lysophospholipid acyltransferase 1/2